MMTETLLFVESPSLNDIVRRGQSRHHAESAAAIRDCKDLYLRYSRSAATRGGWVELVRRWAAAAPSGLHRHLGERVVRTRSGESFLKRANRLDAKGHTDKALDLVYDQVDELMWNGSFQKLDSILASVHAADYSADLLLGILTATFPGHHRLPVRKKLYEETERVLRERGEYEEGLLVGLEG
jgi:hypothetical protein